MTIKVHTLKTWPEHYRAVTEPDVDFRKTVEIRKNDRDFEVGDVLVLQEFDPQEQTYTGEMTSRKITHILSGHPWLPDGYVALSIREWKERDRDAT